MSEKCGAHNAGVILASLLIGALAGSTAVVWVVLKGDWKQ